MYVLCTSNGDTMHVHNDVCSYSIIY